MWQDSWESTHRDPAPNDGLKANHRKFPQGMAAVARYVRGLNLTLGLYTVPGNYTCSGEEGGGELGSFGHVQADIDLWVREWGVGYIKNCRVTLSLIAWLIVWLCRCVQHDNRATEVCV